ncbi:MAG: fluoride efflux transporter CrcB [Bacteroidales bacterium]|nr:fluoride efflux transporter CrcB [Bacteroidales bacterium]
MKNILFVLLGSGIGGVLRYLISKYLKFSIFGSFPLATFLINILGCFLIGLFCELFNKNEISENLKILLTVGFCGGFTTFSTFSNESFGLIKTGDYLSTAVYISISVFLGILAVYLGSKVAGKI